LGLASLKTLALNNNPFGQVMEESNTNSFLRHMVKLEVLELRQVGAKAIGDRFFDHVSNTLDKLDLSSNQIESLGPDIFKSNLRNLKELLLINNRMRSVDPGTFAFLYNLRELGLESNPDLGSIDLSKLTINLTKLDISNIGLCELANSMFKSTPYLTELKLNKNKLLAIPQLAFEGLRSLNQLDLSDNQLGDVSKSLLQCGNANLSCSLTKLCLAGNKLKTICLDSLAHFRQLDSLDLSRNLIDGFEPQCNHPGQDDLLQLSELDLSSNKLASLQQVAKLLRANDNKCLVKLNLSSNQIESIDDQLFFDENFSRLKYLNLSNNAVKLIRPNTFNADNLISLVDLDLSHNKLASLSLRDSSIARLLCLESLNLVGNGIKSLKQTELSDMVSLRWFCFDGALNNLQDF
jgi:Leucine-rich repeat (LRR) protein